MLYPYYTEKKELPLTAWGYIYNEENPKQPIFWPTSMEQFQQFTRILEISGIILDLKKITKNTGGKEKEEIICRKSPIISLNHNRTENSTLDNK